MSRNTLNIESVQITPPEASFVYSLNHKLLGIGQQTPSEAQPSAVSDLFVERMRRLKTEEHSDSLKFLVNAEWLGAASCHKVAISDSGIAAAKSGLEASPVLEERGLEYLDVDQHHFVVVRERDGPEKAAEYINGRAVQYENTSRSWDAVQEWHRNYAIGLQAFAAGATFLFPDLKAYERLEAVVTERLAN